MRDAANRLELARSQQMPFDPQFNAAVMTMANRTNPTGWDIVSEEDAPGSLDDLIAYVKRTGGIDVSGAHSEETIYGCPEHNAAFRAWHDAVHYAIKAEFNLAGEAAVAFVQIAQLYNRYGGGENVVKWAAYILSEVIGQAMHTLKTGDFPTDQVTFFASDYPTWLPLAEKIVSEYQSVIKETRSQLAINMAEEFFGKRNSNV